MTEAIPASSDIFNAGAICFGAVIGWVTYRTLRRTTNVGLSDIGAVVGAVGGGAVLGIFERGDSFGWYAIGLFGGFFGYLLLSLAINRKETVTWMGGGEPASITLVERSDAGAVPIDQR
jgi:hypothetical protein